MNSLENEYHFNINLQDDKINIYVNKNGYFKINILNIDNDIIYYESKNMEPNIVYWFCPSNKSYRDYFTVEIFSNEKLINKFTPSNFKYKV